MSAPSGNVLVVYRLEEYPLRATVSDHLYSLRRYSNRRVFHLNLGLRRAPRWLTRIPFDVVLFHTSFLSGRWAPGLFEELTERARPLAGAGRVRVMAPQDEFFRTEALTSFAREFDVSAILSVSPASEWPKQYPGLAERGVEFREVLTGYLDDATVERIDRIVAEGRERDVAIGYRAWHASPWLGSQGQLKTRLAEVFDDAARERGLPADISTRHEDTILGDDWLRYLAACRYTIGVEGGASVLDADGTLNARTESFLADNPGAPYEEVEAACFPGRDGELQLKAISPRHFEACATRTCQILVAGDYNGVLRPGDHYIELKEDFSNLDEVLDAIERDNLREEIAERAYRDVVASGEWTYARFVADLDAAAVAAGAPAEVPANARFAILCRLDNALDRLAIARARVLARIVPPLRFAARRVLRRGRG